jgi:hypothetical protein
MVHDPQLSVGGQVYLGEIWALTTCLSGPLLRMAYPSPPIEEAVPFSHQLRAK